MALACQCQNREPIGTDDDYAWPASDSEQLPNQHVIVIDNRMSNVVLDDSLTHNVRGLLIGEFTTVTAH